MWWYQCTKTAKILTVTIDADGAMQGASLQADYSLITNLV